MSWSSTTKSNRTISKNWRVDLNRFADRIMAGSFTRYTERIDSSIWSQIRCGSFAKKGKHHCELVLRSEWDVFSVMYANIPGLLPSSVCLMMSYKMIGTNELRC